MSESSFPKQISIQQAVELYRDEQVTAWKAAELAGVSLRAFYKVLEEQGVFIQYSEHDLELDLIE
jgi:predicted HTH domain antitoxin